ncbi:hypothetical protein S245_048145, partial [Arachis hypogaea]
QVIHLIEITFFSQNVNNGPSTSSGLPESSKENASKAEKHLGSSHIARVFGIGFLRYAEFLQPNN